MMTKIIDDLLANQVFLSAVLAWFVAQSSKTTFQAFRMEKWDWERLLGSGGFPSAHTSFVVGLTSSLAFVKGLDSSEFAIAFVYATIVMYDASGVRLAAGKQAKILNELIRHHKEKKTLKSDVPLLKELIGHTPFEVFGGAIIGFVVALAFHLMS